MEATAHPSFDRELCADFIFIPLSEEIQNPFPIAMANPFDEEVIAYLESIIKTPIHVHLAAPSHLRKELFACYGTEEEWAAYTNEPNTNEPNTNEPSNASPPADPISTSSSLETQPPLNEASSSLFSLSHLIPNWSTTQSISINDFRQGRF